MTEFPIQKMKKGMFFQMSTKDCERSSNRVFEIYDKAANREISIKDLRNVTRDIYSGLGIRKVLKDDEQKAYFKMFDKDDDGVLKDTDFIKLMLDYFGNPEKNGSLDLTETNRDLYCLREKEDCKYSSMDDMIGQLKKEGERRFGKEFMDYQMNQCKVMFEEVDVTNDHLIEFKEIYAMFEKLYQKIGIVEKKEKLSEEDVLRLLEFIDFDANKKVGYNEWELFYLKGMLGS